ncbi:hypothetical protein [Pseudoneobacillus sp. C159]
MGLISQLQRYMETLLFPRLNNIEEISSISGFIELGVLLVLWWLTWILGYRILETKRSLWFAILATFSFSTFILATLGWYLYSLQLDTLGRTLVFITFISVFLLTNGLNILLLAKKNNRKFEVHFHI